ncbi:MAG: hypothetical protein M3295_04120 [Chloroflexota bacterium]|nr:hypothetical protein [Chloroflexota bacterium]
MRKTPAIAIAALLFILVASPAVAAPPERGDVPTFTIALDEQHGFVIFANITRDAFCAWEASDFAGEPPVVELVPYRQHETPTGAIIYSERYTSSIELWALDPGADLSGPCQDTDESTAPWAAGEVHWISTDNDLNHRESVDMGLNRTNAFGSRGQATVWDASGQAWHYSWLFHAVFDRNLDYRDVFQSTLSRNG